MSAAVTVLAVAALVRTAAAGEHDATFAKTFGVAPTAVREVAGYELPAGIDTTHVLIGRFDAGPYVMTGAVLLRCDENQTETAKECTGRRAEFGDAAKVELAGVVDLYGAPVTIPSRGVPATARYTKVPGARNMKFPALVIRTTEKRRAMLYLVSLVDADRAATVLQDTAEERGVSRTYKLDKGDTKGALDVIVTERDRRCADPGEIVFALEERHYRPKTYPKKRC